MCNSYNVRKLKASEIEIKPCQVAKDKSWVQVLCYKTSRVDMQVLTEMYGSKWKSSYQMVGDSLFCTISVYDSDLNEWISRTDCGEKDAGISEEKSYATSAFKRAATQFGIGIELYSTPRIKFNTKESWFYNDKLTMTFSVSKIEWDGETLKDLVIVDKFCNVVYDYKGENDEQPEMTEEQKFFKIDNKELLIQFCRNTKATLKTEAEVSTLEKFYKWYSPKMADWKGNLNLDSLYKGWCERERK